MDPRQADGHGGQTHENDAPLREEEVTAGDRLDDRVSEGEGLADAPAPDAAAEAGDR